MRRVLKEPLLGSLSVLQLQSSSMKIIILS
jgi:hypothetical protein